MGGKGVVVGRGRGEQGESGGGGGLSHIKAFPRDQSEEKEEEEGKQRDDYFLWLSGDIWRATTVVLHCRYCATSKKESGGVTTLQGVPKEARII